MAVKPHVVVLNSTSSAGKTTLAHAIRSAGGQDWAVASIDKMFALLHPSRKNDWATYLALTKALFQSAGAMRESGFSVVVDTVFGA
jgi:chloramphenicol 3-O-phosphotransferase